MAYDCPCMFYIACNQLYLDRTQKRGYCVPTIMETTGIKPKEQYQDCQRIPVSLAYAISKPIMGFIDTVGLKVLESFYEICAAIWAS